MSKFTAIFFVMIFGLLALSQLDATEYPAPPRIPAKFNTPEEVQQYLGKLHNYYVMVGRPRFGKRSFDSDAKQKDDYVQILSEIQRTLVNDEIEKK